MRTFIASEISDDFKKNILPFFDFIKKNNIETKFKFTDYNNIHLTYIFLGDILKEKDISILSDKLKTISMKKINFYSNKLGFFPSILNPRVVWADVDENASFILKDIYNKIKTILNEMSIYINDNDFVPHITLARVKKKLLDNEIEQFKKFNFNKINCVFNNIAIYNSTLTPKGPIYNKLFEVKFL